MTEQHLRRITPTFLGPCYKPECWEEDEETCMDPVEKETDQCGSPRPLSPQPTPATASKETQTSPSMERSPRSSTPEEKHAESCEENVLHTRRDTEPCKLFNPHESCTPPAPPPTPEKFISIDNEQLDEIDGWKMDFLVNTVKVAVVHLLNIVLQRVRKKFCYGCEIDHPSQKQHACLFPDEDDFFYNRFYSIVIELYTPNFVPAIQHLLYLRKIRADDNKVRIVAETLLFELRGEKRIQNKLNEVYADLVEQRGDDPEHLELMQQCWESK